MSEGKRRLLEPRDRLDRVLYALLALGSPSAAIAAYHGGLDVAAMVLGAWSVITAFYTIEWAVISYRKFDHR